MLNNKSLLIDLYKIHAPSGGEKKIKRYIKDYINTNIGGCDIFCDNKNMYITKGKSDLYPCVVAHLDQVQKNHSRDFEVIEYNNTLIGFSSANKRQEGLGADDKNGIFVALECLKIFDNIKVAFFHSEEIGCVGSSKAQLSFFDDCRYVLQADRRDDCDLITTAGYTELCSKKFADDILALDFGYKETNGMLSDVVELKDNGLKISCINASCGYYHPHTDYEVCDLSALENCLNLFISIIENLTERYEHEDIFGADSYYDYDSWYSSKSTARYFDTYDNAYEYFQALIYEGVNITKITEDEAVSMYRRYFGDDFDKYGVIDALNDFLPLGESETTDI